MLKSSGIWCLSEDETAILRKTEKVQPWEECVELI